MKTFILLLMIILPEITQAKVLRVLIPLPASDFDPSEVGVSWKILRNHQITFATPKGSVAKEDTVMMTGKGLGIFAKMLMADSTARTAMNELRDAKEFQHPISYAQVNTNDYDALLLPGGHAQGMKELLESKTMQQKVAEFFDADKPIASICHGTVLAARSVSQKTGKSVLLGRKLTVLPKRSELLAWNLTKKKLGNYYRTYPETTVEDEVKQSLATPGDLSLGPPTLIRDTAAGTWPGYVGVDRNLVTARWPGDVHRFALTFKELLEKE